MQLFGNWDSEICWVNTELKSGLTLWWLCFLLMPVIVVNVEIVVNPVIAIPMRRSFRYKHIIMGSFAGADAIHPYLQSDSIGQELAFAGHWQTALSFSFRSHSCSPILSRSLSLPLIFSRLSWCNIIFEPFVQTIEKPFYSNLCSESLSFRFVWLLQSVVYRALWTQFIGRDELWIRLKVCLVSNWIIKLCFHSLKPFYIHWKFSF